MRFKLFGFKGSLDTRESNKEKKKAPKEDNSTVTCIGYRTNNEFDRPSIGRLTSLNNSGIQASTSTSHHAPNGKIPESKTVEHHYERVFAQPQPNQPPKSENNDTNNKKVLNQAKAAVPQSPKRENKDIGTHLVPQPPKRENKDTGSNVITHAVPQPAKRENKGTGSNIKTHTAPQPPKRENTNSDSKEITHPTKATELPPQGGNNDTGSKAAVHQPKTVGSQQPRKISNDTSSTGGINQAQATESKLTAAESKLTATESKFTATESKRPSTEVIYDTIPAKTPGNVHNTQENSDVAENARGSLTSQNENTEYSALFRTVGGKKFSSKYDYEDDAEDDGNIALSSSRTAVSNEDDNRKSTLIFMTEDHDDRQGDDYYEDYEYEDFDDDEDGNLEKNTNKYDYSNEATSIFFQGTNAEPTQRVRKFKYRDDDDNGSQTSA